MATRLTGFSKLVITLVILAGLFFGGRYLLQNTKIGQDIKKQAEQVSTDKGEAKETGTTSSSTSGPRDPNTLRVQLVTWGGYAPGLYFNEGPTANEQSRFFKDYGFKVEFKVENVSVVFCTFSDTSVSVVLAVLSLVNALYQTKPITTNSKTTIK